MTAKPAACDFCNTAFDLAKLGRKPIARCGPCRGTVYRSGLDHLDGRHRDYPRFWCMHCWGFKKTPRRKGNANG